VGNPWKRFETSLAERSEADKHAFYSANFADLMGSACTLAGA